MVVTWDRSLKIRRNFTNDGRDISDVLKQVEEVSALGMQRASERRDVIKAIDESENDAAAAARVRSYILSLENDLGFTIDAMKTTIDQLAGLDGRKILLHVSDGLPQSPGAELWSYIQDRFRTQSFATYGFEFDKTTKYLGIIKAANAAGVTIYTVDAMGLSDDSGVSAENATTKARINTFVERQNLQSMLTLIAEETGGASFLNRNDITVPLKEIEKDYTSYYSLGYRSLRSGGDRPHSVDVKVNRKGLRVRARRTYQEKSTDTRIAEAVASGLFFTRDDNPLGIAVELGSPVPYKGNFHMPVLIRIPYSRITLLPDGTKFRGRLLFYFLVIDASDKQSDLAQVPLAVEIESAKFNLVSRTDFIYEAKLEMGPGPHRLSLAVRDEITNTVSYLQRPVFVSALPASERKPATR
jgi:VWFA-related protein